jgi:hypothetical protein
MRGTTGDVLSVATPSGINLTGISLSGISLSFLAAAGAAENFFL